MCMLTDEPARFGDWAALLVCRRWGEWSLEQLAYVSFATYTYFTLYPEIPSVCFYPLRNELNFSEILTLATKVSDSSRPLSPSCTRLTPIDRRYTALYQVLANPPPYACAKVTACLFCTSSA